MASKKNNIKNTINSNARSVKSSNIFMSAFQFIHTHVLYLNNSKFFAGLVMILLNVGSKFISIQFSKSTEEYLKFSLSKQLLVFSMAWMGTRDIYAALMLIALIPTVGDFIAKPIIDFWLKICQNL